MKIMKKYYIFIALSVMSFIGVERCLGDATVQLNNKESDTPIYIINGVLASGDVYVEILSETIPGGPWSPIQIAGSSTTVLTLSQPGYFDAGVGVIPGAVDNATVNFQVRAWTGGSEYETAPYSAETPTWSQSTGSWNPNSGLPATGPILQMPYSLILNVPEPSSIALGILGGATLLVTNKVKKAKNGKTKVTLLSKIKQH